MTFIYQLRTLTNGEISITELLPVSGEPPEAFDRFQITINVQVGNDPRNGQPVVASATFALPANSVEEAFAIAPQFIRERGEEMLKQARSDIAHAALLTPANRHERRAMEKMNGNGFQLRITE